jgi:hypothetical protein
MMHSADVDGTRFLFVQCSTEYVCLVDKSTNIREGFLHS